MNTARNRRNVALFYTVCFFQGMVFYSPVATLYRQSAGVGIFQIGVIESICLAAMLLLEIPWGWWADRLGHRRTLVLCAALYAVSKVIFWRADSFGAFLAERLVMAFCFAGLSGCDSAYLFSCCGAGDHRAAFSRWEGIQTAGLLMAALAWPLLGGDYRLAALLTVVSSTTAALLALFLSDPEEPRAQRERERPSLQAALRGAWTLAPVLLAFCLLRESAQMITVFLGQLQFLRAGIPQGLFGLLQAAVTAAGLVGVCSHRLTRRLGTRCAGVVLTGAGVLCCLLPVLFSSPVIAVAGVVLLRCCQSLLSPLATAVQNERVSGPGRATQLSCNAMLMDLGALALHPAFGALAEGGVERALVLGALCCAGAALLLLWHLKPTGAQEG